MARRKDEEGERTDKMQQVEESAARPFGGKTLNGTATARRDDSVEQSLDDFVRQAAGPTTDDLDAAPEASQPSLVVEPPRVDSSLSHLSSAIPAPTISASQPRITTAPQSAPAPGISYGILFGAIAAAGVLAAVIAVVVVKFSAKEPPPPAAKIEAAPVAKPAEPTKPAVEQLPAAAQPAPAQAAPAKAEPVAAPVKAEAPVKAAPAPAPAKAPVKAAKAAPVKPHAVKAKPAAAPVKKNAPAAKPAAPAKKNELADPGF